MKIWKITMDAYKDFETKDALCNGQVHNKKYKTHGKKYRVQGANRGCWAFSIRGREGSYYQP